MSRGGRTVGGSGGEREGKSLRELAADAAERRLKDDTWCGSAGKAKVIENESTESHTRDISDNSSIIQAAGDPVTNTRRTTTKNNDKSTLPRRTRAVRIPDDKIPGTSRTLSSAHPTSWTCSVCTLFNQASSSKCEVCGTRRSASKLSSSSSSSSVSTPSSDRTSWTCPVCGIQNGSEIVMCLRCDFLIC
jgi:DNA-dependent metalloprotease WSS1